MTARRPKKCPRCRSDKVLTKGDVFRCEACDYVNDLHDMALEFRRYKRR